MSMGHVYTLVFVSWLKETLQHEIPAEYRLRFLEHLAKWADHVLTPKVLALVEPMDEKGLALMNEIRKLGPGPSAPNMFVELYNRFDVFAALNPSLQRAYDEACRSWGGKYEESAHQQEGCLT